MSFDLMTFEISAAPRSKENFEKWFAQQTKWEKPHSYEEPTISSAALQNWFSEMKETYPPMNGSLAPSDEAFDKLTAKEEARVTDYSFGSEVIYAAFAWSAAEEAYYCMRSLALKYGVGFYSPESGEVLFPDTYTKTPLELRTNNFDDSAPSWDRVEQAINNLTKFPEEFLVLKPQNDKDAIQFIQAAMDWIFKKESLFKKAVKKPGKYLVEVRVRKNTNANKLIASPPLAAFTQGKTVKKTVEESSEFIHRFVRLSDLAEVRQLFLDYYNWRTVPDIGGWEPVSF
ncbi:hypothetical protein ACYULU_04695 [Breznakiellaceae bacterium SP9]